jgi:hypothetical protein
MKIRLLFIFLFCVFFNPTQAFSDENKKAIKLLSKGNFYKTEKVLHKKLKKDSLNPGAKYLFSLLYLSPNFDRYDIDSSYFYILEAIDDFPKVNEKTYKRLNKLNITMLAIEAQKAKIDSIAFDLADSIHTLTSFNTFLSKYPTAIQKEKAIKLRNDLAYAQAQSINTYESYKAFLDTYPDADQVRDAKEMFDILLFESHTKDKKLNSYVNFLRQYPNSPFREQAEKNIFEISTAKHDLNAYLNFLNYYPNGKYATRALSYLYHLYKTNYPASDFLKDFPNLHIPDSLKNIISLETHILIPVYENNLYGFINTDGITIIPPSLIKISSEYLCGNITSDFLIADENDTLHILSREGRVIAKGHFDEVRELGQGLLKIKQQDYFGVLHKEGFYVMPIQFEEIELLQNKFIKYKKNGLWGVRSLTGRPLLETQFENIEQEGKFIILTKEDKVAITNTDNLLTIADNTPVHLNFRYEDIDLIGRNHIIGIAEDKECLLTEDLKEIFPLEVQRIIELKNSWLIKKEKGIKLYDKEQVVDEGDVFDDALYNKTWLALKKGKKWTLMDQDGRLFPDFKYDSVQLFSDNTIILHQNGLTTAFLSNKNTLDLTDAGNFHLLKSYDLHSSNGRMYNEYLLAENKKGYKRIYTKSGKLILQGMYGQISAINESLLMVTQNNKKGLIDSTGQVILPIKYEGLGNYKDGFVSILHQGKFGIFSKEKKTKIEPEYEVNLYPYNRHLLIAVKNTKQGLISLENKVCIPFQYEEIKFWTDSIALVKDEKTWKLLDIYNKNIIYDQIDNFWVAHKSGANTTMIIQKNNEFGVINSIMGEIIPPTYNDLINLGNDENPVYFAEKKVAEAGFFVVVYLNKNGEIIRRQAFTDEEYDNIYCD